MLTVTVISVQVIQFIVVFDCAPQSKYLLLRGCLAVKVNHLCELHEGMVLESS